MTTALLDARTGERTQVQPAGTGFYRPELDVLRFFAFFCVFAHHVIPRTSDLRLSEDTFPGMALAVIRDSGACGVCLFFLLSAYLITELLIRERKICDRVHLRAFYMRRAFRIWPLYFSFLLFCVVLGFFIPAYASGWPRWLAFLLVFGNWYTTLHGFATGPASPMWSVSLEEQFYLFWPWLLKLRSRAVPVLGAIAMLVIATSTLGILGARHAELECAVWTNGLVQIGFFALGILLACGLNGNAPKFKCATRLLLACAGLALWAVADGVFTVMRFGHAKSPAQLWSGYGVAGAGCVALFMAALGVKQRFPKALLYLGKISYGLYVFHVLAIACTHAALEVVSASSSSALVQIGAKVLMRPLALLLTIAMAHASYVIIEKPFLRRKEKWAIVSSRPV